MNRKFLLRFFCLLLSGVVCFTLASCGGEHTVPTDSQNETAKSELGQTDETEIGTATDSVSSSDAQGDTDEITSSPSTEEVSDTYLVRQRIRTMEFGLRATSVESSDPVVARGSSSRDYLTVDGYSAGSAILTLTDCFGFSAKVKVTVNVEKKKIDWEVSESDKDKFVEVCMDFGAQGGSADDTNAFQRALDAAKPGDTVYVYPGRYNVSLLAMREGVTLRMHTTMTDATKGFTDQIASDFKSGKITVLSGTRILNNDNKQPGVKGCSNFSIIGGAIDENLTDRSTLIFGCAKNVTLENVIFKDIKNNHIIQVTGSSDMEIKNCMFAGFTCGETFTREVVQVEPSTPGATGGPLTFGEGEFNCPKNITISHCYFGKSDESGAPLIAIGHHSRVGEANVTNFRIVNNVFDECLHAAIRYNNIVNTEISGNTFISSAAYKNATQYADAKEPSLIQLYHQNGNTSYKLSDGTTVVRASAVEQAGIHGIKIENNTFILEEGSDKKILRCVMGGGMPGATYISNQKRQDTYQGDVYTLNGYRVNQNYASDLSFCNNTVQIKGQPAYKSRYISLEGVYGITFENNKFEIADGISFLDGSAGFGAGQVVRSAAETFVVQCAKSDRTVTLVCGDQSVRFVPSGTGTLTLNPGAGGSVTAETDRAGNLTVTVVPDGGYRFHKLTDAKGNTVSGASVSVSGSAVYNILFSK